MSEKQMMIEQERHTEKEVYSYHTFLFPFVWKKDCCEKEKQRFLDFLDNPKESYWEKYTHPVFSENLPGFCDDILSKEYEEARLNYGVYQYFNEPARRAIYGDETNGSDGVRNYRFQLDEMIKKQGQEKPLYEIDCTVKRNQFVESKKAFEITPKSMTYQLDINAITLRLYPVGIGILVYELENREYRTLEDVKDINEYGRRVQLAALQVKHNVPYEKRNKDDNFKLTAHRIRVCGIEEDFSKRVESFAADRLCGGNPWKSGLNHLSDTVTRLFERKDTGDVFVSVKEKDDKFYMEPGVDDRMFVFSLLSDGTVLPATEYCELNDLEGHGQITLKSLYEFIYVDSSYGLTCQSTRRLKEELESSIYDRWIGYGTLYGVTQYSMVCMTGPHIYTEAAVINPFLTVYKEMVQLVMVQRAAITMFAARAAVLSEESKANKEGVAERILEMQKEYVAFQNQILLFDVTAQLQGVQLYKMLQNKMEILPQEQEMEKQLQNLYEISQTESSEQTNSILNIMAIFGMLYTGIQTIQQQIVDKANVHPYGNIFFYIMGFLLIVITFYQKGKLDPNKNKKGINRNREKIMEGIMWFLVGALMIVMLGVVLLDAGKLSAVLAFFGK